MAGALHGEKVDMDPLLPLVEDRRRSLPLPCCFYRVVSVKVPDIKRTKGLPSAFSS